MSVRILVGDCRARLTELPDASVQACVTSPPHFGLRDYGHAGQMGLESTPDAYVAGMVAVFREVRRVLKDDGTLWLNLGDSYHTGDGYTAKPKGGRFENSMQKANPHADIQAWPTRQRIAGLKPKDLIGIPWRVAFALQADGWYLRSDIIWHKPNPMPESVTDRPTKSHEYLFLLSKSERYYYDADAIAEPVTLSTVERMSQPTLGEQEGSYRVPGKTNGPMKAVVRDSWKGSIFTRGKTAEHQEGRAQDEESRVKRSGNKKRKAASARGVPVHDGGNASGAVAGSVPWEGTTRNRRTVWTVPTMPFKGAHFATFPPALIEPCILAGSARGDTVLDPFGGAGTTGLVADRLGREVVLCELNAAYARMAAGRIRDDGGLFAAVSESPASLRS